MTEPLSLLAAFCAKHSIPFKRTCRHCNGEHTAQSFHVHDATDREDDETKNDPPEFWGSVDYGRCAAMDTPHKCLKMMFPCDKAKRDELKQLVRDLVGD